MQIRGHDVGVCSWSIQPDGVNDLIVKLRELQLQHVQLALTPLLAMPDDVRADAIRALRDAGIQITAGMINFSGEDYSSIAAIRKTGGYLADSTWEERREITLSAARFASEIGMSILTTHIGFVPPSSDPAYQRITQRVEEIADVLAPMNVTLLMETGQETAPELLQFLNDLRRRNVAVNFDPANMILYGAGDPIDAIRVLGRHIRHVHVKDATLSDQPRMKWGSEVPFGTGQVRPRRFLDALEAVGYTGPLVIEREAGKERLADIRQSIRALEEAA
jgi:L-ribulose-5-phosphate 3-epimerase